MTFDRRTVLASAATAASALAATRVLAGPGIAERPTTIWATATDRIDYPVADRTVRLAVRATTDARLLRVRVTNAFGTEPLVVSSLHIGRRQVGPTVRAGTNRAAPFNGQPSITIPIGASAFSDAVPLPIGANEDLLISVAIAGAPPVVTGHLRPKDDSYLSGPGDHGGEETGTSFGTVAPHWFFADALVGSGIANAGSVAIIGDSITDSGGSPRGGYQGWVDELARRVAMLPQPRRLGFVNAAISGNRIASQRPGGGVNAMARLDRDVLSHAGVHTLIVYEGINDIYGSPITAGPLIQAHAQLAARARLAGLRVIGATLLPTRRQGFTAERESVRAALNAFIRTSPVYDGVIDFEAALRDPADPLVMAKDYYGDGLHPSAAGYRAMAAAVPLKLLYP